MQEIIANCTVIGTDVCEEYTFQVPTTTSIQIIKTNEFLDTGIYIILLFTLLILIFKK